MEVNHLYFKKKKSKIVCRKSKGFKFIRQRKNESHNKSIIISDIKDDFNFGSNKINNNNKEEEYKTQILMKMLIKWKMILKIILKIIIIKVIIAIFCHFPAIMIPIQNRILVNLKFMID